MDACKTCHRSGLKLSIVTGDDIQRKHGVPGLAVCEECLAKIRSWARLESDYTRLDGVRDTSIFTPSILAALLVTSTIVSLVRGNGLAELPLSSNYLGLATMLTGILYLWKELEPRYGFTHDLRWSLKSRHVILAFSIVLAGILTATISSLLH